MSSKSKITGILAAILCIICGNISYAADNYTTLINENFEGNYVDRGDVNNNITLSEKYDGYADSSKKGYMVSKQMTSFIYSSESADRAGYNYADRIHSGYNSTYGNLGAALCLYPSNDWWICMNLGYGGITARELSEKTLDINFGFADSGDAGRTAQIKLLADADGTEREFLIGYKTIKRGTQILNSYHKRVNLADVIGSLPKNTTLGNVRIKLAAPKGKTSSVVKLDDIHIREVNPSELVGWDFEAEDLYTSDFDKSAATLSTVEDDEVGRVLKIKTLKSGEARVRFYLPKLTEESTFKISLKAKTSAKGKIKIRLANVGTVGTWEFCEIGSADEFKQVTREIDLSDFYSVADDLKNASLEIAYKSDAGDACYIDDLSVTQTEKTPEKVQSVNINENFEYGYIDRGSVHSNILLSEDYDGYADRNKQGYMVYKQILASEYNKNESDRVSYDSENREYGLKSDKWGNLGSAIYLYPQKENWWINVLTGYKPMSGREFGKKALDINITFADSGSSNRSAAAVLCYKANGVPKEYKMDEKNIKTGTAFLNTYHRRIKLSELSVSEDDIISDISFKLTAPKGKNESVVKFDDIHIRETDPAEIIGWDFEAEDLYTSDFSTTTEHLSSVKLDGEDNRVLKIRATNAEFLKQTRFDIADINENTVLDISLKIKIPKTNSVCKGADIQLRYMEKSGDLNIGKIPNSDEFIEFKKTIALSDIKNLNTDFSRAALEVKFEGDVGDVCYIDDVSVKEYSVDDDFWADVQDGAEEYFATKYIFVHFNNEMDSESIKHIGNIRINDSTKLINRIEMIDKNNMIITLNQNMQEGYRYILEFRNLKSIAGNSLEYKRYPLLIKENSGNAIAAMPYQAENAVEAVLPLIVNCDTETRVFKYIAAAYDKDGKMLSCDLKEISIDKGDYAKNIKADLSDAGENMQNIKLFLWENDMTPQRAASNVTIAETVQNE